MSETVGTIIAEAGKETLQILCGIPHNLCNAES